MFSRKISRVFIVLLSFALLLIDLEVALRISSREMKGKAVSVIEDQPVYQLDSDLIYSFRPNSKRTESTFEDFIDEKIINKLGFRDLRGGIEKNSRILVAMGDSFVEGIGVDRKDTYPAVLESQLKRRNIKMQVINAGISGYGPDQVYRLIIKKILPMDPDIILWNITYPDDLYSSAFWLPSLYSISDGNLKARNGWANWQFLQNFLSYYSPGIIKNSYLYSFVFNKLQNLMINIRSRSSFDENLSRSIEKLVLQLNNLKEISRYRGIELVVVFVPMKNTFNIQTGYNLGTKTQETNMMISLKSKLDKSNINYIDIYNEMKLNGLLEENFDPHDLFYIHDVHPNEVGNMIFAKAVSPKLTEILSQ